MKRILTLTLVALALTGTGAAATAVAAPSTTDFGGPWGIGAYDTPDDQITHASTGNPTWVVTVENDTGAVQSWANDSESREVLEQTDTNRVVLAASGNDIGTTLLQSVAGAGLSRKDYVERVTPNRDLSLAETVSVRTLPTAENYTYPEGYRGDGVFSSSAEYPTDGIALRDTTNETTIADSRAVIGADSVSATGAGSTVAVIDTGLNTANGTMGLESRVRNESTDYVEGGETVGEAGIDAVEDPSTNSHGTYVTMVGAGDPDETVSGETYEGVAPEADILAMRVLADGSGSTADIAQAVRDSEAAGADVITMSLGSQFYTSEVVAAMREACAGNVTQITVATGNSRRSGLAFMASPSDAPLDCVTAVTASNTKPASEAGIAGFAQLGPDPGTDGSAGATTGEQVDVAAPGMLLETRMPTPDGGTTTWAPSGTSMSTPQVGFGTAVLLDAEPGLANDSTAVNERLTSTAAPMPRAAAAEAGHGLFRLDRAIADNTSGQSQQEAMDDAARQRDEFWRGGGATNALDQLISGLSSLVGSVAVGAVAGRASRSVS